jgi:hypothetical protein
MVAIDRFSSGSWQRPPVEPPTKFELISMENSLTERGTIVSGTGMTPNWHDVLTGSTPEGRAFPANMNLTCSNWTSSTFGSAMLGHIDRNGVVITPFVKSWNAAHMSRSCSQPDLIATGGNGLFYCFAQERVSSQHCGQRSCRAVRTIDYRFAKRDVSRLPALAAELVDRKVTVVYNANRH